MAPVGCAAGLGCDSPHCMTCGERRIFREHAGNVLEDLLQYTRELERFGWSPVATRSVELAGALEFVLLRGALRATAAWAGVRAQLLEITVPILWTEDEPHADPELAIAGERVPVGAGSGRSRRLRVIPAPLEPAIGSQVPAGAGEWANDEERARFRAQLERWERGEWR